eukprot:m.28704 g.28704  ORF g.28704 m.28704 type:complete len:82 (-) comp6079_c0_seq2:1079-1324(-)
MIIMIDMILIIVRQMGATLKAYETASPPHILSDKRIMCAVTSFATASDKVWQKHASRTKSPTVSGDAGPFVQSMYKDNSSL